MRRKSSHPPLPDPHASEPIIESTDIIPQVTEGIGGLPFHETPAAATHPDGPLLSRIGRSALIVFPRARRYGAHSRAHAALPVRDVIANVQNLRAGEPYRQHLELERHHPGYATAPYTARTLLTHNMPLHGINPAYYLASQDLATTSITEAPRQSH